MTNLYLWVKAAHVFFVIAWMAGMFYLPRLFVYHTEVAPQSDADRLFQTMERRLLRIIINPAMIMVWVLGLSMIFLDPSLLKQGWLHAKILLVLILSGLHGMLSKWRRDFANGVNKHSARFYRLMNEVPTVCALIIVVLVILKPF